MKILDTLRSLYIWNNTNHPLVGELPDGRFAPVQLDEDGKVKLASPVEIAPGDIQIGAVEIKDATTAERATIVNGKLQTENASGNAIASDTFSIVANGLGAPSSVEAPADGNIIGILKRLRTLLSGVLSVAGFIERATATFSRPSGSAAYSSGQLIANSATAGSVTPLTFSIGRIAGGSGMIRRARLHKSGAGLGTIRLHLFNASPTVANGDTGTFSSNGRATYMGAIDIAVNQAFTDGSSGFGTPNVGSEINFKLASGQVIFGLLEARGTLAVISAESFSVDLEVHQN